MSTLALQIFLLLLSAFLVGCMLGCLLRRAFFANSYQQSERTPAVAVTNVPAPVSVRPATAESARFERALTGGELTASARARQEPEVEVRPRPVSVPPVTAPTPQQSTPVVERPKVVAVPVEPAPPPAIVRPPVVEAAPIAKPVVTETVEIKPAPPTPEPVVVAPPPPPPPPPPAPPVAIAPPPAPPAPPAPAPVVEPARMDFPLSISIPPPVGIAQPDPVPQPAAPVTAAAIAAAAAAAAASAASAAPSPAPAQPLPADGPADDLQRIRGIDAGLQTRLNATGVRRFSEVAAWKPDDVARISQTLGFTGRIEQENWIEQAQILARGGETEYAKRRRLGQVSVAAPASTPVGPSAGMAAAAGSAVASHMAAQAGGPDRLTRIIGLDGDMEKALNAQDVSRFIDIARWTPSDVTQFETLLGRPGRITHDNWVEQARILARVAGEPDGPRPSRLADAIRENSGRDVATQPMSPRPDLSGLRSVRSTALRGDVSRDGPADDLKRVRGIGAHIERRLNSLGIMSYDQIANWTRDDIDRISQILDFKGRIERENWVEQARILVSGGQTEFSRRVDRGEVDSSKDQKD